MCLRIEVFQTPIKPEDVVWSYSGVRPLYDDGAGSAAAATRDYVLKLDHSQGVPVLNVFGGKITTYRMLAEHALSKIAESFPQMAEAWTAGVPLPGGDFPVQDVPDLKSQLMAEFSFLDEAWANRLIRTYGTEAQSILHGTRTKGDLGEEFGATLTEREVHWLMEHEFAQTAEDVIWRRTKLGLRLSKDQTENLARFICKTRAKDAPPKPGQSAKLHNLRGAECTGSG